jgi:hypothetical protein
MSDEEAPPLLTKLTEQQIDMLFNHAAKLQDLAEVSDNMYIAVAYANRSIAATNLIIAHMLRAELVREKLSCD